MYSQQDVSDLYGYRSSCHNDAGDSRFPPATSKAPPYERSTFFSPPGANGLQAHFNGYDKPRHGSSNSKYQVSHSRVSRRVENLAQPQDTCLN